VGASHLPGERKKKENDPWELTANEKAENHRESANFKKGNVRSPTGGGMNARLETNRERDVGPDPINILKKKPELAARLF